MDDLLFQAWIFDGGKEPPVSKVRVLERFVGGPDNAPRQPSLLSAVIHVFAVQTLDELNDRLDDVPPLRRLVRIAPGSGAQPSRHEFGVFRAREVSGHPMLVHPGEQFSPARPVSGQHAQQVHVLPVAALELPGLGRLRRCMPPRLPADILAKVEVRRHGPLGRTVHRLMDRDVQEHPLTGETPATQGGEHRHDRVLRPQMRRRFAARSDRRRIVVVVAAQIGDASQRRLHQLRRLVPLVGPRLPERRD